MSNSPVGVASRKALKRNKKKKKEEEIKEEEGEYFRAASSLLNWVRGVYVESAAYIIRCVIIQSHRTTKAAKFIHGCDFRIKGIKRGAGFDRALRQATVEASYNDFDSRILVAQASWNFASLSYIDCNPATYIVPPKKRRPGGRDLFSYDSMRTRCVLPDARFASIHFII